jgi:CheY-like chemotaxis protein
LSCRIICVGGEVIPRELFARYVRDALAELYDPIHLQTHPLGPLLLPAHGPKQTQGRALRELLKEAIESLRPEASVPYGGPEWLGYRLMYLRYVQCLDQAETCRELALSRTSFYRCHQDALDAVVSLLWETYEHEPEPSGDTQGPAVGGHSELAREVAVRIAHEAQRRVVRLRDVLDGAIATILPLAEEQGITLTVKTPEELPEASGDPAMLRQIILDVLTGGFGLAAGNALELVITPVGDGPVWRLRGLDRSKVRPSRDGPSGFGVSRGLLEVYGGRLWVETDDLGNPMLCFIVPAEHPRTILIVDDDADTISLYRRYLHGQGYVLQVARGGEEMQALIAERPPDLVLLDVLMPREDGWDVLQRLRRFPATAYTPVIVCSVLSQWPLARALGAAELLEKPIDQEPLLRAIQKLLAERDSAATGRRARPG